MFLVFFDIKRMDEKCSIKSRDESKKNVMNLIG